MQTAAPPFPIPRPEKMLFPRDGITKLDIVEYYRRIAPFMLPFLRDRPVSLERFPNGVDESGFYQKEASAHFPPHVERHRVPTRQAGDLEAIVVNNDAALVYLAIQATLTLHGWLSTLPSLEMADRLVIDLDPQNEDFAALKFGARLAARLMREVGLTPFPMLTGSRGIHVVCPLDATVPFDTARLLCRRIAEEMVRRHPDRFTIEARKINRRAPIYLDVHRNAYGQTTVIPYSVRALPGAPIAVPLTWDELGRGGIRSSHYTIRTIFRRLARKPDPWEGFADHAANASEALARWDRRSTAPAARHDV